MTALVLAVAVTGTAFLLGGSTLVVRGRVVVAAALQVAGGAALVGSAVLDGAGRDGLASVLLNAGAFVLIPLALTCYPVARLRHPADFVAAVCVSGAGAGAVLRPDSAFEESSVLVIGLTLVAHIWWRIETRTGDERRALQWMALALATTTLVAGVLAFASESTVSRAWQIGVFALVALALYVGATLPDIVDVRALVVGSVVLAVAAMGYVALFVLVAGLAGWLGVTSPAVGTVALLGAVLATTFHPTQVLLRGVVDELLFGARPDPLDAASRVAGRIGDDPLDAVRTIRAALVVPYAAIRVGGEDLVASGTPVAHVRAFDLDLPGATGAASLVVGLRPGDLGLSPGDEHVLQLTVPLLSQTLRARALAEQLTESRGAAIAAIEEERRRLRRDLHDGLGPRLSGIAFTSDAARNVLRHDPDRADELLLALRGDTVRAIEEIRQIVYAMRPPALDELGLVPALRQQAVGLIGRDGDRLTVSVSAPDDLAALPAAVEVAAYRIVVEALANVARHTASPSARVRLAPDRSGLSIEVFDAGGPTAAWASGVGLSSMRERAVELGGSLVAGPGPAGGRVAAYLPL